MTWLLKELLLYTGREPWQSLLHSGHYLVQNAVLGLSLLQQAAIQYFLQNVAKAIAFLMVASKHSAHPSHPYPVRKNTDDGTKHLWNMCYCDFLQCVLYVCSIFLYISDICQQETGRLLQLWIWYPCNDISI